MAGLILFPTALPLPTHTYTFSLSLSLSLPLSLSLSPSLPPTCAWAQLDPKGGSIRWKWVNILRSRLAPLISCIFGLADTKRDIQDRNNCGFLPFVSLLFPYFFSFFFILYSARCKNAKLPCSYRERYELRASCCMRLLARMLSDVVHDI